MKRAAAPRNRFAVDVRRNAFRANGAALVVKEQIQLLNKVLDLLHGDRDRSAKTVFRAAPGMVSQHGGQHGGAQA